MLFFSHFHLTYFIGFTFFILFYHICSPSFPLAFGIEIAAALRLGFVNFLINLIGL